MKESIAEMESNKYELAKRTKCLQMNKEKNINKEKNNKRILESKIL